MSGEHVQQVDVCVLHPNLSFVMRYAPAGGQVTGTVETA
ncbi:hypothetical protein BSU04_22860 [Caballeronia sordidicola]|uniref:NERD domain-containing protein n=1 Tax=Caballeronia sordidicola TaxID=196367 RepID=A0A226X048_CABSO|nr:hypothetical protein BSU04_22860 [Caballeronia sordidicola]